MIEIQNKRNNNAKKITLRSISTSEFDLESSRKSVNYARVAALKAHFGIVHKE